LRDFIDVAARVLTASEQRLETVAANVANASTPGFKRSSTFQMVMMENAKAGAVSSGPATEMTLRLMADFSSGDLSSTGAPLDLAIEGAGFFAVRTEDGIMLTRAGQFQRREDGRIVSAQGYALQDAAGGDLIVGVPDPRIMADGTVLEDNLPTGRIALSAVDDPAALVTSGGSLFSLPPEIDTFEAPDGKVRQGMLENANVAMPAEMLETMEAVRQAESGARLVQLYDTLMGRAISAFGQRS